MMVSDIFDIIDNSAPFSTQLGFDNSGLLVGDPNAGVTKVAIALDATIETVNKASELGCQLLVTHHPIIFSPLKHVTPDDVAFVAVSKGIAVISAHTNLDASKGGVNDCLAKLIGMTDITPLSDGSDNVPMARIGKLNAVSSESLARHVKSTLGCGCVKFVPCDGAIKTVAVCGGAGSDFIISALKEGAQALITGECRHHERLMAKQLGIALLECGHFATEQPVKTALKAMIESAKVEAVVLSETDPAMYI